MDEWRAMTLRDAGVELIDCVHNTPKAVEDGYPYIAIPQMKNGRIDFKDARKISHSDFIEWTKKARPQLHDVVLSRRTNPGVTATFGDQCDFALGQNLVLLRADGSSVLPEFLRWLLVGPAWWGQIEKFNNVGAIFDSLRCADVPRFELPIPPKSDRGKIAALLGALDDKIELNRRMNETLEAMARAIFKDWFVDFGPTRAKQEGCAPYLAPDIWSLFPNRLDDEGKPDGWNEKPLDQVADFLNGIALQKYPTEGDKFLPVIKIAQLRAGNCDSCDKASTEIPAAYVVENGDVLFSWSGSLLHRVWTAGRGALNQHLFKVTSDKYPKWFFFHWIGHHMADFQATAASKATTMGHIQRHHLTRAMTVVPDHDVMRVANNIIGPLFDRRVANDLESRTLATTRNLLLPKLMSGEVRVKGAEKIVGEAT
jgi:type I restriction enzyme, S subunit